MIYCDSDYFSESRNKQIVLETHNVFGIGTTVVYFQIKQKPHFKIKYMG